MNGLIATLVFSGISIGGDHDYKGCVMDAVASALSDLGPRSSEDLKRIIPTSGSIVDSLGTLRNRASLAHANQELLDQNEALLVINIARSLLRFFDSKFS